MPVLFGREIEPDFQDLAHLLQQMEQGEQNPSLRALAANLQLDHRITPDHARRFLQLWREECKAAIPSLAVSNAIRKYREEARTSPHTTFLSPENARNFLPPGDKRYSEPFVTVLSVASVFFLARKDGLLTPDEERLLPRTPTAADYRSAFSSRGETEFVKLVLAIRNRLRRSPVWAARFSAFAESAHPRQPVTWKHSVGLDVRRSADCIILCYYHVPTGVQLVRPSQLDAGDNPLHYPSPANWRLHHGGCCMIAGQLTLPDPPLVQELIHQDLPFSVDHWLDAQKRFRHAGPAALDPRPDLPPPPFRPNPAPSPVPWPLLDARTFHSERLRRRKPE